MTTGTKGNGDVRIQRQNRLSERCLEAIVNAADFAFQSSGGSQDYAGVDYTVQRPIAKHPAGGTALDVQLKSVGEGSSNLRHSGDRWSYDLDADTHDRLTVADRSIPMVLVLVVFPQMDEWLYVADSKVIMMCTPYLIDLAGYQKSGNPSTKTVRFGIDNVLDPAALDAYIESQAS